MHSMIILHQLALYIGKLFIKQYQSIILHKIVEHTLYKPNVSNNDVISIVHSLKNTSPGWDGLPAFVAKQCVNRFITPLTKTINMCITQGVFPNEIKLARVVPVYKVLI